MDIEHRVSAATWAIIVVLVAALGGAALGFAGYSLAIRELQNRAEQSAVWLALRLRDTGVAAGNDGKLLRYSHTVETLPAGAVVAHDRGAVRVAVRLRSVRQTI